MLDRCSFSRPAMAATLAALVVVALRPPVASAQEIIQPGDLIATGQHSWCLSAPAPVGTKWFRADGSLLQTLSNHGGTDAQFSSSGELFVGNWFNGRILVFDRALQLVRELTLPHENYSALAVFTLDQEGNLYRAGEIDHHAAFFKLDPAGNVVDQWMLSEMEDVQSVDLAADQCTLFYVAEEPLIRRFDVCGGAALPPIPVSPADPYRRSLRILGDGSILLTGQDTISRLDDQGTILQSYTVPGITQWRAIAEGLDGRSFWASSVQYDGCQPYTANLYQLALETGAVLAGPYSTSNSNEGYPLIAEGIAIYGGPRAAIPPVPMPILPRLSLLFLAAALAAVGWYAARA